ncbi:Uncharacterised protein [Chlamydia abortus]|nr:Uncharacterised protein [Chlamydia abortus]SGA31382.1 Uncharacterised protein [Chlamydia abortus]SGA32261.1 Uncharacterised protein [Chlamydia abortus]
MPPKASISFVIIPLADPPIEGLHGSIANLLRLSVIKAVLKLRFASAYAASIPAWPPPITIASNCRGLILLFIFSL